METLVSRRVRQQKRRPCKYLPECLFAFNTKCGRTGLFACPARPSIKRLGHTWLQHTNRFSIVLRITCGLSTTPSMTTHSSFRYQFGNVCQPFFLPMLCACRPSYFFEIQFLFPSPFSLVLLGGAVWPIDVVCVLLRCC